MLKKLKNIFFILSVIGLMLFNQAAFAQKQMTIKNIIKDKSEKIILVSGSNFGNVKNASIMRLSSPYRAVIDIPDAVLTASKVSMDLTAGNVKNVKIAQFSKNPNIVRVVFTADNEKSLDKLVFDKVDNSLVFNIDALEQKNIFDNILYQDKVFEKQTSSEKSNNCLMTYKSVVVNDNSLTLAGFGRVSVKQQFELSEPDRVVIDLPLSTMSNNNFFKEYTLKNNTKIRIGQFEENTIRLVISTKDKDSYKTIISPDSQSLTIVSKDSLSALKTLSMAKIGDIKNINIVSQGKNKTLMTLNTNQPIFHSIKRINNKLELELYNINAPERRILSGLKLTKQLLGVECFAIDKYSKGIKLSISLDKAAGVKTKLSANGKKLDIILESVEQKPTATIPVLGNKFVVIDPGHGGCDPGAARDGIQEKDITLDVSKRVGRYLKNAGIDVMYTRVTDDTVSLKDRVVLSNTKSSNIFVSVHVNSSTSDGIRGIETHWYTPQSQDLAKIVQNKLISAIVVPDRGIKNSQFYVIHHTIAPSVLVEIGFISNAAERCQIMTEERKEATAKAIADGIVEYLKNKK